MEREPIPSAIVARLLEAAKELEEWVVEHRQASLAEHEQGVLRIFRRAMGPHWARCWNARWGWITRPPSGNAPRVRSEADVDGRTSGGSGSR